MIGILLAAGFSHRFGTANKLMQPLPDGRPMALVAALNLVIAVPTTIAVLRPENNALEKLLVDIGLNVVFCSEQPQSMADSLVAAIAYSANFVQADDGFVIALADMPYIKPATIVLVANQLKAGASIVIPTFDGKRGHPVGFSGKFRHALMHLTGDEGARSVIKQYADEIELVSTNDNGILMDIDTPADLPN